MADLTYVTTHSGWVYVSFIIDLFSRFIVGWQISTSLRSDLALDALEMAIYASNKSGLTGLIHRNDRGVQYLSIYYSERLGKAEIVASVGSKGDSYDCEHNRGIIRLTSDPCYDWPECLGVDLSASDGWRSTQTSTRRAVVTQ